MKKPVETTVSRSYSKTVEIIGRGSFPTRKTGFIGATSNYESIIISEFEDTTFLVIKFFCNLLMNFYV